MQCAFGSLDLFIFVAVAIPLENPVSAPLVVAAAQELGDFELDGFLKHELGTQADRIGERSAAGGEAEELFFKELAGSLTFHDVARFLFYWRRWSLHPVGFYRKHRIRCGTSSRPSPVAGFRVS